MSNYQKRLAEEQAAFNAFSKVLDILMPIEDKGPQCQATCDFLSVWREQARISIEALNRLILIEKMAAIHTLLDDLSETTDINELEV